MTEVVRNLPIATYHASSRLSTSKLADFADGGPRLFAMRHLRRSLPPREQTDAMRFGQLFEDQCQGRSPDWSKYAIKPEGMSFATKPGKEWRDAPERAGKEVISQSDLDDMKWMHEAVYESELACEMIRNSEAQVSMLDDFACHFGLQSRPDWINFADGYSIDLKTCQSFDDMVRGATVRERRYHCQAELVVRLATQSPELRGTGFVSYILAVEKQTPYRCQLIEVTAPWLSAGKRWLDRQIAAVEACFVADSWPRVTEPIVQLADPPAWL